MATPYNILEPWKSWADVPAGEKDYIISLRDQWEQDTGYFYELNAGDLFNMAVWGVTNEADVGKYVTSIMQDPNKPGGADLAAKLQAMPWAGLGMTKDTYQSLATTYGTEYKKITGKDIPPDQLAKAFQTQGLGVGGGLLSGSQYAQQLMNDAAIQAAFGWVKYGLDYTAWTQQKLQLRTAYGRDITDAEASTILQYNRANQGANMNAIGRAAGQQQPAQGVVGVGGSMAR